MPILFAPKTHKDNTHYRIICMVCGKVVECECVSENGEKNELPYLCSEECKEMVADQPAFMTAAKETSNTLLSMLQGRINEVKASQQKQAESYSNMGKELTKIHAEIVGEISVKLVQELGSPMTHREMVIFYGVTLAASSMVINAVQVLADVIAEFKPKDA